MLGRHASIVVRRGVRGVGGAVAQIEVNIIVVILILLSAIHVRVITGLDICTLHGVVIIGILCYGRLRNGRSRFGRCWCCWWCCLFRLIVIVAMGTVSKGDQPRCLGSGRKLTDRRRDLPQSSLAQS